jgi:hypothetical protein
MPNTLDGAIDRFNQAVERLDGALAQAGGRVSAAVGPTPPEIKTMQDDRAQLALQLDQSRSDFAALQAVTDEVESKLDVAIENIRTMMRG